MLLSRRVTGYGVPRWSTCIQSSEFHSFQWHYHSLPVSNVSALPPCLLVWICSDVFVCSTGLQHSVTQTTLQTPCTPLSGGFDSGLTEGTAFSIMITNDQARELQFSLSQRHFSQALHSNLLYVQVPCTLRSRNGWVSFFCCSLKFLGVLANIPLALLMHLRQVKVVSMTCSPLLPLLV